MRGSSQTFEIAPSRNLKLVVAGMHALACAAVLVADLDWWSRGPLLAAIAVSLVVSIRRPRRVSLRCQPDGSLSIMKTDDWQSVELLPDTVVLAWLVVLRYRRAAGVWPDTVVVLPDCLEASDFRHLRVWLKWRAVSQGREVDSRT